MVCFPFRNRFILFDLFRKSKKKQVNLNWWNRTSNLGDAISPIVVEYMLSLRNISSKKTVSKRKHLYAVGSNLTSGIQDCTVWGSGILNCSVCYRLLNRKLDIRAIRGPLTRIALMDYGYQVPQIYGDPGILLPEIYNPQICKTKAKYGLIYHASWNKRKDNIRDDVIEIEIKTDDYRKFVHEIKSVQVVISSSLHGIILAEAYGIPAILLKPEKDFVKYYDWYYSTNRMIFPVAESVEEAMSLIPAHLPDLEQMRNQIKDVFPYDLYEE